MWKWRWYIAGTIGILGIAVVIGWKAKTCEAKANKCISSLVASSVPNKSVPPEEAISSCRESQCYLCRVVSAANIPDVGLFFVGILAVLAGLLTLGAIQKQAEAMERQISVPNRAYLTNGKPELTNNGTAKIPIQNYGHIEGKIISLDIDIMIQSLPDRKEIYRRNIKEKADESVVPKDSTDYAIFIRLPREALTSNLSQVIIGCTIEYEVGFRDENGQPITDILKFCPVLSMPKGQWVAAWQGMEIDFQRKDKD